MGHDRALPILAPLNGEWIIYRASFLIFEHLTRHSKAVHIYSHNGGRDYLAPSRAVLGSNNKSHTFNTSVCVPLTSPKYTVQRQCATLFPHNAAAGTSPRLTQEDPNNASGVLQISSKQFMAENTTPQVRAPISEHALIKINKVTDTVQASRNVFPHVVNTPLDAAASKQRPDCCFCGTRRSDEM